MCLAAALMSHTPRLIILSLQTHAAMLEMHSFFPRMSIKLVCSG